jgi:hypothetical protein
MFDVSGERTKRMDDAGAALPAFLFATEGDE